MAKRIVVLLVALGLLAGLGMPLNRPCCSLAEIASSVSSPDCCPMPDCCRGEKRESSPVVPASAVAAVPVPALISGLSLPALMLPSASASGRGRPVGIVSLHGPPVLARGLPVLLSTLRV